MEHISLSIGLNAATAEWHVGLELYGRAVCATLVNVGFERAIVLGINPSAWAQAQAAIGKVGTALLVIIADADSNERGGKIRMGAPRERAGQTGQRAASSLRVRPSASGDGGI